MELLVIGAIVIGVVLIARVLMRRPADQQEARTAAAPASPAEPVTPPAKPLAPDDPVTLPMDVQMEVVGEFYRGTAMRRITNRRAGQIECTARLVREPDNSHDPNAIKVVVRGLHVGYLARNDARAYQPMMARLESAGQPAVAKAVIASGYKGDELEHQVTVWLPQPSFGEGASA